MLGFAILLSFNIFGVWLHNLLHLPLPGNVLGLILFLIALGMKWIKLEWVEHSAQFLLDHMLLFFIPYVVGIVAFMPVLEAHWVSISAGIVGSTLVVLWVTGLVASKLQKAGAEEPAAKRKEDAAC